MQSLRDKTPIKRQNGKTPVLVPLVHDVLNRAHFADVADLADAVKTAAAKLRIPYSTPTVAAALRSVGARRPLVTQQQRREG